MPQTDANSAGDGEELADGHARSSEHNLSSVALCMEDLHVQRGDGMAAAIAERIAGVVEICEGYQRTDDPGMPAGGDHHHQLPRLLKL